MLKENMDKKLNQLLVFTIDQNQYAIRLSVVERAFNAVKVTPLLNAPETILGLINIEGEIIPVINMRRLFNLNERDVDPDDLMIMVTLSQQTIVIWVDAIIEVKAFPEHKIVQGEDILPDTEHIKNIEGALVCDDGMVLIYNLDSLLWREDKALIDSLRREQ